MRPVAGLVAVALLCWLVLGATIVTPQAFPFETGSTAENTVADAAPVPGIFREFHDRNLTGEGVRVGIVDPTGFDPTNPDLAPNVNETRSFDTGNTIRNQGRFRHGTAAASSVTTIAPEADLLLANFDTESGYIAAIGWLRSQEVDVIVAPLSFYGKPDDGSSAVERATERAIDDGIVVVAPTGNLAHRHWEGRFEPTDNGTLLFDGDDTRNRLSPIRQPNRLVLWLSWDRTHRTQDYDLVVYRHQNGSVQRVAESHSFGGDPYPNERVVTDLEPGTYSFAVRGPATERPARLEIESPTHTFEFATPSGSITTPASTLGVLAVGAYNPPNSEPALYSSQGPTADGRVGVDVIASGSFQSVEYVGFTGTSSAAAYVGGIVTLLLDANPDLGPIRTEEMLEYTVDRGTIPHLDRRSGYGPIDPEAALDRIERRSG